ncbi:MAG: putative nucleotidyltransferase substrate binding domain-containing protein [Hyphomicrobiales bacterium]
MTTAAEDFVSFAIHHSPFDALPPDVLHATGEIAMVRELQPGDIVFDIGERLACFYLVRHGVLDVESPENQPIARLATGESFGARALLRDGITSARVIAVDPCELICIPATAFLELIRKNKAFSDYFDRVRPSAERKTAVSIEPTNMLASSTVRDIMTANPITVPPATSVREAAGIMRAKNISCVLVEEDEKLTGILTAGDLAGRVVAEGRSPDTPVSEVMTTYPYTLEPDALVFEAMLMMSENGIGHLPITEKGRPAGIITQTNLVRRQSISAVFMISDIGKLSAIDALAGVVQKVPQLLAQLVGSGMEPFKVGHLITTITDALTKRLLTLGREMLGPEPVPYLWLACGSQGRREQTGVSDQDNCLIFSDDYVEAEHGAYFEALAKFVSDGLNACGYFYCPGDMMATNPRWRQPLKTWRRYFRGWIDQPDPMAQMLSSVMFDLRPIAGDLSLFEGLQRETLDLAKKNSIFRAHMIANSLKHTPPIGFFGGFALIRSGEHKDTVDLKHGGIVPIVDLARVYALAASIEVVNTRDRLIEARKAHSLSESGADDLIDAFDFISKMRLEHQARQIRDGVKPDNFMAPGSLSALERRHLKDAFGVITTLQSALGARSAGG